MEEKVLTYFSFLILFIGIPLIITILFYIKRYQEAEEKQKILMKRIFIAIIILIIVALIYTTPWDNYLVENNVWYYDPEKVMGILIGFVPIEEYAFFVVQTILIGLISGWILLKGNDITQKINSSLNSTRIFSIIPLLMIWFISLFAFFNNIEPLIYLNLIVLWGFPPIIIQLTYGANILYSHKRELILTISISTLYLAIADAIAISEGIWIISNSTSINALLGGILPIEEFVFFLITNILIIFGLTLITDLRSITRFKNTLNRILS